MVKQSEAILPEAKIDNEMISEVRKYIGLKLRTKDSISNKEATEIAIHKFADGIGDTNPLWTDPEYATKTRYRKIIAPPSWVFSVFAAVHYGFRALGGFHSSSDIHFYKPVFEGDAITPEMTCTDVEGPKKSAFAEKTLIECNENLYRNQRGDVVAKLNFKVTHFERLQARKKGKYQVLQLPHPWTQEELERIEEEVLNEHENGANTPSWDDVEIGQKLKPVVKGPITMTDEIAFLIGGGAPIPRITAHRTALQFYRRHPAWAFRDPASCGLEPMYAVHYNQAAARAQALPYPYDVGFQRHCWQIHLLTNFAGDNGWLKRSSMELRRHVYFSDVVRLEGTITDKFIDEDNECCVKIETTAINQRGEDVMPSYGVVALPSKKHSYDPLEKRILSSWQ